METKTAVIEIMKPLAYFDEKYRYQDVPLHALEQKMVYIKKGASGNKMISTKNIKLLKVFNSDDREGIKSYINDLRDNQRIVENVKKRISESIDFKKYVGVNSIKESEQPKKKLFTPRNLSNDENNRYIQWNNEQPIKTIRGKKIRINQFNFEGVKKGYWMEYYEHGGLEAKGNYVNGKMNGYWMVYHDNGNLEAKGNYINGKRDGIWKEYNPTGRLESKDVYKNGKFITDVEI